MLDYARSRITIYRKYKRLLLSLQNLSECKVISKKEIAATKERIKELYEKQKEERLKNRPKDARPVGRPKNPVVEPPSVCKRYGCTGAPPKGQVYCSRDCAPCGHYLKASSA